MSHINTTGDILLDIQSWLIAIISAVIGSVIGGYISYKLTHIISNRRKESLIKGFYNELELNKNYFITWLTSLLDEYRAPDRKHVTACRDIDMTFIDSIIIELVGSGKVLTHDQRQLIVSLKPKFKHIKKISEKRFNNSDMQKNNLFHIDKVETGYLILEAVESLFYLNQIIKYRDNFNINKCSNWSSIPLEFFEMLDIKITAQEWSSIKKYKELP